MYFPSKSKMISENSSSTMCSEYKPNKSKSTKPVDSAWSKMLYKVLTVLSSLMAKPEQGKPSPWWATTKTPNGKELSPEDSITSSLPSKPHRTKDMLSGPASSKSIMNKSSTSSTEKVTPERISRKAHKQEYSSRI